MVGGTRVGVFGGVDFRGAAVADLVVEVEGVLVDALDGVHFSWVNIIHIEWKIEST